MPQVSLAPSSRPLYKSQTATNSTPGTFNAVDASKCPIIPEPIKPMRILSLALTFILEFNTVAFKLVLLAVAVLPTANKAMEPPMFLIKFLRLLLMIEWI